VGPAGTPARLAGREAIREYSHRVIASPLRVEEYEVTELYRTQDPEVVVAEIRATATVTTTGRSFTATAIQVVRIRNGQIVLVRDFSDPRVGEELLGEPRPGS
jgi:ketosteroid isomerase-like protein